MILWAENLYIGKKLRRKKDSTISSISSRKLTPGVYCIAFASNPDNLFDIMDANQLLFPHYKKAEVKIVGLAKGKEEAISLVHDMLLEVYNKTGAFNVRTYFT